MTTQTDDPRLRAPVGSPFGAMVDTELLALDEPALSPDENDLDVDDDPDVRTVATLVGIAQAEPGALPPLSALSQRRVWSKLEGRLAAAARTPAVVSDPHAPAANVGPGWRAVVLGLAAAAVLILPRLGGSGEQLDPAPSAAERERVERLGAQARESVAALGDRGEARARGLAEAYAARLSRPGGGVP